MSCSCCFCDALIAPQFDFCKSCKTTYDETLGPGWEQSDWFQASVKESRRLHRLEAADAAHGTVSVDAAAALDLQDARPVAPAPQLSEALRAIIDTALQVAPDTGWRRMHRIVQEKGITATAKQVRYRLEQINAARRAALGQSDALDAGGS